MGLKSLMDKELNRRNAAQNLYPDGPQGVAMQAKEMKECGVYALPDGREVIAHRSGSKSGFFRLYDPLAWKYEGPPMYETDERGVITSLGRPTPWRVEDLKEVGQTAPQKH